MASTTNVPIEEFLQNDAYEPAADYVDGDIEERFLGEDDHSSWQIAIAYWFLIHQDEWNILIRPELRIQTGPTRFRVADVAILDRAIAISQIAIQPPLAAFEVLSPEDRLQRVTRKLGDYAAMGISEIWVIDPQARSFSRFEDGQLLRRERFSMPARAIAFEMSEIAALVRPA